MKQENKTKSVKKFSIKMLLAMVFGGVLGGFFGVFMYYFHGDLEAFLTTWTKMVQSILVPGLLIVNIVSILAGEFCLWKLKTVCDRIVHPEKRGDISSRKFQQQWLESCDEAEKEVIYQSSYKTYIFMSKAIGLLLIVTMLSHLFFKTGIMAILVVGVMYLVLVGKYSCSCVSLRKDRILRL